MLLVLSQKLSNQSVKIFADPISYKILKDLKYPYLQKAKLQDFGKEFLSLKIAVKTVENIREALDHISQYSTKHSEAIITENRQNAQNFLKQVDAACVYQMPQQDLQMALNLAWAARLASLPKNSMPEDH